MELISTVTLLLSLGTILAHIFIALVLVWYFLLQESFKPVADYLSKHGILIAFKIAVISMLASLFYSNVAGFAPCELCWFQRIFMYPLVVLLGMALWKKDVKIVEYALPLSVIGFIISLYQNYIYYFNNGLDAYCQAGGTLVSCVKRYVFEFGYISIPIMALTGFALIIIFLLFQKGYNKLNNLKL